MRNKDTFKILREDNGIDLTRQDFDFLSRLGFKEQDIIALNSFGNIDFPLGNDDKDMIQTSYNERVMDFTGGNDIRIDSEDKHIIVLLVLQDLNPNVGEGKIHKSIKKLKYVKKLKNKSIKYKTYKRKNRKYKRTNKRRY